MEHFEEAYIDHINEVDSRKEEEVKKCNCCGSTEKLYPYDQEGYMCEPCGAKEENQ